MQEVIDSLLVDRINWKILINEIMHTVTYTRLVAKVIDAKLHRVMP